MEQQTETEVDDSTTLPSANDDTAAAAAPVDVVTEDASTLGRYQIRQLNHR